MRDTATAEAPALLRVGKAASMLGVSPATVYRLVEAGELPALKMPGHEMLFKRAELQRWLAGDGQQTASAG